MTNTTRTNVPGPPPRTEWPSYTDGNWHKVRDEPDTATGDFGTENARRCNAGRMWAKRNGLRLEYRAVRGGRELWLRMVPSGTPRPAPWRQYEHRNTGVVDS